MTEYTDGFAAGFRAGWLSARQMDMMPAMIPGPAKCQVCGISFDGPMGYVCTNRDCPNRVTCGKVGATIP